MTRLPVVAALLAAGCASNLSFRADHRLHWQGPPARKLTAVPVTLSWRFDGAPPASYAVFVDRAPVRPGQTLKAVAGGDQACKANPACPDAAYLANHQVYTTVAPSLALDEVLPLASDREGTQLHIATVILLDHNGHRIGESAWSREFKLRRAGPG